MGQKIFSKTAKSKKRLPFKLYAAAFVLLIIGGIGTSLYLAVSHYRLYTDIFYSSFCAISQTLNCDTVSESPYSIFLDFPVPLWGLSGYLFLALLTPLALRPEAGRKRLWTLFLVISAVFCLISVWLGYISSFKIHSYCLMCIVSYAINFFLLLTCIVIRDRFGLKSFFRNLKADITFLWHCRRLTMALILPFFAVIILAYLTLPSYWVPQPLKLPENIHRGMTEMGHPWIGAENPELEIVEFTDYQCFQCYKMHQFLRYAVAKFPDKIRLVHVHYPMDHEVNPIVDVPFHVGSGIMAAMAMYAMDQGKFWEMNDYLYYQWRLKRTIESQKAAEALDLNPQGLSRANHNPYVMLRLLKLNIRYGMKLEILGTPSFLINGEVYQGTFPFHLIEELSNN